MTANGFIAQATAASMPLARNWFHTVVTSPPYYGLRSYAGMQESWWPAVKYAPIPGAPPWEIERWYGALGAEPSVEFYVGHMLIVCSEVARVLRSDGVFWLNVGDSFAGSGGLCTVPSLNNRQMRMSHYSAKSRGAEDELAALNLGCSLPLDVRLAGGRLDCAQ